MLIFNIGSYEDFIQKTREYKSVIVNISGVWCKPCIALKPMLEPFLAVIDEADSVYLKIDNSIYEDNIKFEKFFKVNKIPYFGFIKDGLLQESFVSGDFAYVSKRLHKLVSTRIDFIKVEEME